MDEQDELRVIGERNVRRWSGNPYEAPYWRRERTWADGSGDVLMVTGSDDDSPQHMVYAPGGDNVPGGYDARCSACWLDQAHTEALHAAALAQHAADLAKQRAHLAGS